MSLCFGKRDGLKTLIAEPYTRYLLVDYSELSERRQSDVMSCTFDVSESADGQEISYAWLAHTTYMRSRGVRRIAAYDVTPGRVPALYDLNQMQPVFCLSFPVLH